MPHQSRNTDEDDGPWLTRQEAATYAHVSVSTIDRARAAGALKNTTRFGGVRAVRIRRRWIDVWLGMVTGVGG